MKINFGSNKLILAAMLSIGLGSGVMNSANASNLDLAANAQTLEGEGFSVRGGG